MIIISNFPLVNFFRFFLNFLQFSENLIYFLQIIHNEISTPSKKPYKKFMTQSSKFDKIKT